MAAEEGMHRQKAAISLNEGDTYEEYVRLTDKIIGVVRKSMEVNRGIDGFAIALNALAATAGHIIAAGSQEMGEDFLRRTFDNSLDNAIFRVKEEMAKR